MITGQIEAPVDEADDFFDPMEFLEKVNEDSEENNDDDITNNENNDTNGNMKNTDDIKKTIKTEDSKMNAIKTIKNDKSEENGVNYNLNNPMGIKADEMDEEPLSQDQVCDFIKSGSSSIIQKKNSKTLRLRDSEDWRSLVFFFTLRPSDLITTLTCVLMDNFLSVLYSLFRPYKTTALKRLEITILSLTE